MNDVSTRAALVQLRRVRRLRLSRGARSGAFGIGIAVATVAAFGLSFAQSAAAPGPTVSGGVTHWGGSALEGAFVAAVLAAAVVCFRALDALFYTDDAKALSLLPVPGAAMTVDRASVVFFDAFVLSAPAAGWALGAVAWSVEAALVGLAFVAATAALSALVALGAVCSAAVSTVRDDTWIARGTGLGDMARAGGIYQIAPGMAFGATAFFALFAKLGFEEPLRTLASSGALELTNAAMVAVGTPAALAVVLAFAGLRGFAREHAKITARYAEIEQNVANVLERGVDEKHVRADVFERRLPRGARAAYRKDRIQLSRSAPFVRAGSWAVGALSALAALGADRVAPVLFGFIAALWIVAAANPVRRLRALAGEHEGALAEQLIAPRMRSGAATLASVRELLAHVLPLALPAVVLAVRGMPEAAAVHVALLVAACATVVVSAPRGFVANGASLPVSAVVIAAVGAVALLSPWLAAAAALAPLAWSVTTLIGAQRLMMEKVDA